VVANQQKTTTRSDTFLTYVILLKEKWVDEKCSPETGTFFPDFIGIEDRGEFALLRTALENRGGYWPHLRQFHLKSTFQSTVWIRKPF